MYPPPSSSLDISALSGISGSISIACWIVVFSPQIIENFRRRSADGLSITFIIVWLLGDVFNVLGAVLQGVLPTMVVLAVYYTLADMVLLAQCFYYKGFTLSDQPAPSPTKHKTVDGGEGEEGEVVDQTAVIANEHTTLLNGTTTTTNPAPPRQRKPKQQPRRRAAQPLLLNTLIVLLVCAAGLLGWWVTLPTTPTPPTRRPQPPSHRVPPPPNPRPIQMNALGQIFGYLCAFLYLGSRLPQILLNYRRKSTEGVSMLFFVFACLGNVAYALSILAYDPVCADEEVVVVGGEEECRRGELYARYVLVNASWLLGSLGTLLQDLVIFGQFWWYARRSPSSSSDHDDDDDVDVRGDGAVEVGGF